VALRTISFGKNRSGAAGGSAVLRKSETGITVLQGNAPAVRAPEAGE